MAWYHRLLNVGRTSRLNDEIERELAFHIAERADALRATGMPEADALREARRRVGNTTVQRERTRDADVLTWLDSWLRDIRHAARWLVRAPLFAVVAIASLAIGIGANTAIFTLIDAVMLRPLSVPAPEELVIVGMAEDYREAWFTNPLWEQLRDRQTGMSAVAAFSGASFNTAAGGEPHRVASLYVSGDFFRVFGVRPALGRLLTGTDDIRGCPPVAVLGHGLWQRERGASTDVLGSTIMLDGVAFEIVGVTAQGFGGPHVGSETQVYVPICAEPLLTGNHTMLDSRSGWWLQVMGRRRPDLTVAQVSDQLMAIASASYDATVPEHHSAEQKASYRQGSFLATAAPNGISALRTRYASALKIMMAGVGLVLLIACANVANLLLARATAREREFAIRVAIGAGRGRLARQLVTESLLIALLGAVLGLILARFAALGLVTLIAGDSSVALDLSVNARVLMFTAVVALLPTVLFGMVPAWRAARAQPQTTMKAHTRAISEGHGGMTFGKALVAAQLALSTVLLVGAALLVGSLRNLVSVDAGFSADGVLVANVNASGMGLDDEQIAVARAAILARMRGLPGVRSASLSDLVPIGRGGWNGALVVEGFTPKDRKDANVWFNAVSDGYFATLDIRMLAGRDFNADDVPGAPQVAIISESVARKFFGTTSPIGRTYQVARGDRLFDPVQVIGVVEDAKYHSLREVSTGTVYLPTTQPEVARATMAVELRTSGDPLTLIPSVTAALTDMHPATSVEYTTLSRQVARSLQVERMLATLSSLFGALALALAMLGLYGVMSYAVARRRNEIGLRIALGADSARVLRMVLGDTTRVVVVGLTAGVIAAVVASRVVASVLYQMSPREPGAFAAAAVTLTIVAFCAGAIPAWRAARMDPVTALRED